MTKVMYMGPANDRVLGPKDLKKAQVENFDRTTFKRGEAVEVSDEVAKALLKGTRLYGRFVPVAEAKFQEPPTADTPASDTPAVATTGTATKKK